MRGRRSRCRPDRVPRAVRDRLSARGPRAQAGLRRRRRVSAWRHWRPRSSDGARPCSSVPCGRRTARSTTRWRCSTAGEVAAVRFKVDLPNYGVFDEKRVFAPGPMPGPISFRGVRIGVPICEDIWGPDVTECLQETGAEILICAQRLAVRLDQARRAHERGGRARDRDGAAARLSSTRSAARTSSSSTVPPSCSTPTAVSPRSCRPGRRRSP